MSGQPGNGHSPYYGFRGLLPAARTQLGFNYFVLSVYAPVIWYNERSLVCTCFNARERWRVRFSDTYLPVRRYNLTEPCGTAQPL